MNLHPMIFISKFGWNLPSDTLFTIFIIFVWFVHSIDYNWRALSDELFDNKVDSVFSVIVCFCLITVLADNLELIPQNHIGVKKQRVHTIKVWWKSALEKSYVLSIHFRYFVIISFVKKGADFHLNKHEFPQPNDALSRDWLKPAQWF